MQQSRTRPGGLSLRNESTRVAAAVGTGLRETRSRVQLESLTGLGSASGDSCSRGLRSERSERSGDAARPSSSTWPRVPVRSHEARWSRAAGAPASVLAGANRDARILKDQSKLVIWELALETEPRGHVLVALPAAVIVQPHVALVESLDAQIQGADICRGRIGFLADLKLEAVDGKRVGKRGRFEIHVQTSVEIARCLAVDPPTADSICLQREPARARRSAARHARATGRPVRAETDHVMHGPRFIALERGGVALQVVALAIRA
jgi:hypothetical protein